MANKKSKKKIVSTDPIVLAKKLGAVEKRLKKVEKAVENHDIALLNIEQIHSDTHDLIVDSKESVEELSDKFGQFIVAEGKKDEARTQELIDLTVKANKYPKLVYMVFGGVIGLFTSALLFMFLILLSTFLPYNT